MAKRAKSTTLFVRTDAVLIHERNEIRFSEQRRSRRLPVAKLANGRHERLPFRKIGHMTVSPLVVGIHLEIVSRKNAQT